jgi:hypothetical protein
MQMKENQKLKQEPLKSIIWPKKDPITALLQKTRAKMEKGRPSDSGHLSNKEVLGTLLNFYLTHG